MGASATKISEPYNRRMISREPTLERLDVARRLLLEPFGLVVGLGAFEAWQKAVVDIDSTACEFLAHIVTQDLHIAR